MTKEIRWSREDLQRMLYAIVRAYEDANCPDYTLIENDKHKARKEPRRFILFGRRLPFLGGDSEILRNHIEIAINMLKDNDWWPDLDGD